MKDVAYVESRENHQAWHVTFARVHPGDNALIYADGVQLKVAKDTGELLGANAMEYIQEENIKKQTAKPIDWKTFFQDDIQVQEVKISTQIMGSLSNVFAMRLLHCEMVIRRKHLELSLMRKTIMY